MKDAILAVQLFQAERAIQNHPGSTLPELCAATGADRETMRDALIELSKLGRAHTPVGALTRCRITGTLRATWQLGAAPLPAAVAATTEA